MTDRTRNYIELEEHQVSETARQIADALALDIFSQDSPENGGFCNACGCPRFTFVGTALNVDAHPLPLRGEDEHGPTHFVVTVGLVMPQCIDDIEQVRCERCDLQCWPAEAE